ncbi:pentapeptide repeat-containing protein [Streptomyces californicus]|uniref:pentapeptide repeat-containing protein n=1 Tax=Streptomyces californicus TaxID=67351 RepID=UPI0033FF2B40
MHDSEKDRRTVIDVLAAFIREAPKRGEGQAGKKGKGPVRPQDAAIQAALVVLSRRPDKEIGFNLQGADLSGLNAVHLNLRGVFLHGASLERISASGADLQRAYLSNANLREADLETACLDDAVFVKSDLTKANLRGASVSGVDWRQADLTDANLRGVLRLDRDALGRAKVTATTNLPSGEEEQGKVQLPNEEAESDLEVREPPSL